MAGLLEAAAGAPNVLNNVPTNIDPLSYISIIQDLNRFRGSAHAQGAEYDMPGQVYFRVLFHFNNGSDVQQPQPGTLNADWAPISANAFTGLIGPSWLNFGLSTAEIAASSQQQLEALWSQSTAYNYLMLNNEIGRADNLRKFVELLSTISAESPWYFQNIKGIDAAIDRQVANGEFNIKEERDKITIECLDDSYDQRIGTLLDLYRSVVWSWETKRVMVPVNLRKFDMTVVAFQMPLRGQHINRKNLKMSDAERRAMGKVSTLSSLNLDTNGNLVVMYDGGIGNIAPVASYKAFEFHGCEIDYNTSKSAWAELNNGEGTVPKYSIDIFFDDMYEIRFNEFMKRHITDLMGDTTPVIIGTESDSKSDDRPEEKVAKEQEKQEKKLESLTIVTSADSEMPARTNIYAYKDPEPGPHPQSMHAPRSILGQIIGHSKAWAETQIKKVYLGNMNGLSLSKVRQQVETALDGNLFGTINNILGYVRKDYNGHSQESVVKNIFADSAQTTTPHIVQLGNIYKGNTILNS